MSAPRSPWGFSPVGVLFDLDGTLADTAGDLAGALNRLRAERGLAPMPLASLRAHASAGARGLLGAGLNLLPDHADYESHRLRFLDAYEQCLAETTVLFEGVPELLDAIEARGLPWGIMTNKSQRFTPAVLAGIDLLHRSGVNISGDTTAHAKPHPLPLLTACEHLKVDPTRTLYVGDDLRDIQAARAAGMPSVAAAWGYLGTEVDVHDWGADIVCRTPADLLNLL